MYSTLEDSAEGRAQRAIERRRRTLRLRSELKLPEVRKTGKGARYAEVVFVRT